jgi:hypothetical protein
MGEDERLPASLEAKHRERNAHHDQHRRSRRSTARRSFLAPREMSLPRKMRTRSLTAFRRRNHVGETERPRKMKMKCVAYKSTILKPTQTRKYP